MTALVVILTVVVALLGLLVVSLLRSHAEILRRLHEIDPNGADEHGAAHDHGPTPIEMGVRPGVALPRENDTAAHDVAGTAPNGDDVALALVGARTSTLLAFLSSGCLTCLDFWHAFSADVALPEGVRLVVVTKGEEQESVSRVAELAPPGVTVVLSTQAWLDYEVPMAPYFILVDGPQRRVRGEGAASSWPQLVDLLAQARDSQALDDGRPRGRGAPKPVGAAERESLIDRELSAAGITPGDPSLYPDAAAFGTPPGQR